MTPPSYTLLSFKNVSRLPLGKPRIGKPRIVFMSYAEGESPAETPPQIILIRPNETPKSAFNTGKYWENFGVLTLTSHLERSKVRFGVLEASLFQCSIRRTVELVTKYRPRFVGISVFATVNLDYCLRLAAALKKQDRRLCTILGGHGASFVHKQILENNACVDIVVRGEAEKSLEALLNCTDAGDWAKVPGLSYKDAGGIHINPDAPIERNLDMVPLPHRFARDIFSQDPLLCRAPLMSISSRGCFDRCKFCSVSAFYSNSWRGRSASHVVDEVEYLVERYGRKSIHFWDDLFIGPGKRGRDRAMEIADEIVRRRLEITFHMTTRPPSLDKDLVKILVRAGLKSVFLGIENEFQDTLDYFGKHARAEDGLNAVNLLWENGVYRILTGYILFHPQMRWADFRQNLDFMDSLPNIEPNRIFSRLGFYPGTAFWLEVQSQYGRNAYKMAIDAPLPDDRFERLNEVSYWFYQRALGIEPLIVALEEQHLHDDTAVRFLAVCRTRLFRFLSQRVRLIGEHLENDRDDYKDAIRCGDEIEEESLKIVSDIRERMNDTYLRWLLHVTQLEAYEKRKRSTRPVVGEWAKKRAAK